MIYSVKYKFLNSILKVIYYHMSFFYALAPMDGITDMPFRIIVKEIFEKYNKDKNKELLLFTEFVSSDGFVHNFDGVKNHLVFSKKEKPIICQIFGSDLYKLSYTAKKIDENYDFDWIDLNVWCPAPKIMRLWAGSALMINKENTLNIIKNLSKSIKKPFSIKTRAGLNQEDKAKQKDFIIKASDYCWLISIHARTLKQWHSWEVDVDFVLDVKQKVNPECKIIFNWWINEEKLKNAKFMEKMHKLDWIMIWQAAIWNPWIFVWINPTWEEKKEVIWKHLNLSVQFKWEKRAVIEFRKFIWSYIKWVKNASKYRAEFMKVDNLEDFKKILDKI